MIASLIEGRHYIYRLKGEYSIHVTPKNWFRRYAEDGTMRNAYQSITPSKAQVKPAAPSGRKTRKQLILSQTMVIDIDPHKVSSTA